MPRFNYNSLPVVAALSVAGAIAVGAIWPMSGASGPGARAPSLVSVAHAGDGKPEARWAASATGRVEPVSGLIHVLPEVGGVIDSVPVSTNDKVVAGDLLAIVDEGDIGAKLMAARAEVEVREFEREEEPAKGLAKDRQDADDAVASGEREVFSLRRAFDAAYVTYRGEGGSEHAVTSARDALNKAEKTLETARADLAKLLENPDMPLLTRLESSLAIAQSDLSMVEHAHERTRVRAPFDGTVLNVFADVGAMTSPSARQALVAFGDISKLRVRAEVEERDIAKVRVGQKVVIRVDAFPGREFSGTVREIASALGAPRIATKGPRRPNDVDVLEVVADVDGTPPLVTGMRVDVFFKKIKGDAKADKTAKK